MHRDPQDLVINGISLGKDNYMASSIAVGLVDSSGNTIQIDAGKLKYKDGTLTIDKSALESVPAGTYNVAFVFDDPSNTVDYTNVTLTVKGVISSGSGNADKSDSAGSSDTTQDKES